MVTIQGQPFCPDISLIEKLLGENPSWGRTRLSVKLCELWDWRAPNGQIKDMGCRNLLLRLEQVGQIRLPPRQRKSTNAYLNHSPRWMPHPSDPVEVLPGFRRLSEKNLPDCTGFLFVFKARYQAHSELCN